MTAKMLTIAQVNALQVPGKYLDQHGLYAVVTKPGQAYWMFRYQRDGRERAMSFGSVGVVTLAMARQRHLDARRKLADGIDPLEERQQQDEAKAVPTLAQAAAEYISAHRAGWRSEKHAKQWDQTLARHVLPRIGAKPVDQIDGAAILSVLNPIWRTRTQTAARIRNRLELILDYAEAKGWRSGANPARWKGHLRTLLPAVAKLHRPKHHAALPWAEAPAFMARLWAKNGMSERCLAFGILTGVRSGEVRGCRWDEVHLADAVWHIPGERMKMGRPHRVPLPQAAMDILRPLWEVRCSDLVFFSPRNITRPLSEMALTAVLRRLDRGDLTVHGFRSSLATWAADHDWPPHVIELALAHVIGGATQAAYQRSDLLEQRRGLMTAWAAFLTEPAQVIPMRAAG
jgi:integrase